MYEKLKGKSWSTNWNMLMMRTIFKNQNWATKKKNLLTVDIPVYWLVNRDPYNGLL